MLCTTSVCHKCIIVSNIRDNYTNRLYDFHNQANTTSSARIMVLPKLTFVLLRASFLSPLLCRWWFAVCALWLQCKTWESAVLTGILLTLFFGWNVTYSVWSSRKRSVVMHRDRVTHPLFWSIATERALMVEHSVFM